MFVNSLNVDFNWGLILQGFTLAVARSHMRLTFNSPDARLTFRLILKIFPRLSFFIAKKQVNLRKNFEFRSRLRRSHYHLM